MRDLIPIPTLPEPYGANYEGESMSYQGEQYYRVTKRIDGERHTVFLYYTNNRLEVMDTFGGAIHDFPTREAMMEYIRTTCTLDIWEYQGEE